MAKSLFPVCRNWRCQRPLGVLVRSRYCPGCNAMMRRGAYFAGFLMGLVEMGMRWWK